ncbi:uncharacterized protein WM277_023143 [Molossus nigricans]
MKTWLQRLPYRSRSRVLSASRKPPSMLSQSSSIIISPKVLLLSSVRSTYRCSFPTTQLGQHCVVAPALTHRPQWRNRAQSAAFPVQAGTTQDCPALQTGLGPITAARGKEGLLLVPSVALCLESLRAGRCRV